MPRREVCCKDCAKRSQDCHVKCTDYAAYRLVNLIEMQDRVKGATLDNDLHDVELARRKRRRRKGS